MEMETLEYPHIWSNPTTTIEMDIELKEFGSICL